MFNICESQNFLWSSRDILGKGATATVYRGIDKFKSISVAVKCYDAYTITPENQIREFEVLRKVNHENVVKLIAIEENEANRKKVIVMELCNGGSLLANLLNPENAYGLEETEFLLFLKHLCNGMKYLRDNNIVHRDLKPGNIMKCIEEDGTNVYKLTDFGAARELKDGETFQSLYGTEQYLHPDLYERAVLGRRVDKKFCASTDLWSVGVMLYHVATGTLPFRVYSGYRNKETLHNITTKKSSGVISGVQIKDNGPIIWSKDLPKACLLSDNLKERMKIIIAGLLEADYSKMWGFDNFFKEVDILLSHITLNIFYVNKAQLFKLYMLPDQKYEDLQRRIKEQTKIMETDQILLHKSNPLSNHVQYTTSICEYPPTREDGPLFLFNKKNDTCSMASIEIPEWDDFPLNISVETDIPPAKNACVIAHYCKRHIDKYSTYCKLINDSIEHFIDYMAKDIKEMQVISQHLYEKICILKKPARILQLSLKTNKDGIENDYCSRLKGMAEEFATGTALEVTNLYNIHCIENILQSNWSDMMKHIKNPLKSRASARGRTQVEELQNSCYHFTMQSSTPQLSYNEGQWHILTRTKIRQRLKTAIHLLTTETYPQYQQVAKCFEDWYKTARNVYSQISTLRSDIEKFEEKLRTFDEQLAESCNNGIKNRERHLAKVVDTQKSKNSEQFRKRWREYYDNKKNVAEILSENSRLMNQIQDFTKNLKL